jgi:putative transposase
MGHATPISTCASSLETSKPGAPPSGRGGPGGTLRGLRTPSVQGHRPVALIPAPGLSSDAGREGQASPAPPGHRQRAPALGLEDRACHPAPRGLGHQSQAHPAPVALSGPAPARSLQAQAPAARGWRSAAPRRAAQPRLALDFQFDETADHRRLKLLNIVDEHTREALAMRTGRTCDADQVVAVIEALVAQRGAPGHLRMDNGPELIACALLDWCRPPAPSPPTSSPARPGRTLHRELQRPRSDELLNVEEFGSLLDAQVVVERVARRVQHLQRPQRHYPRRVADGRCRTAGAESTRAQSGPVTLTG